MLSLVMPEAVPNGSAVFTHIKVPCWYHRVSATPTLVPCMQCPQLLAVMTQDALRPTGRAGTHHSAY